MLRYLREAFGTRWNWLLWWRIDHRQIHWQAARYDELPLTGSFKGWSVIFMVSDAALVALLAAIDPDTGVGFAGPLAMLVLAVFVHQGRRWAMTGAMLVWTLEKIFQIAGHPGFVFVGLLWWAVFMHAFYMALLVERRRANPAIEVEGFDKDLAILARHALRVSEIIAAELWAGLKPAIHKAGLYSARAFAALANRSNR